MKQTRNNPTYSWLSQAAERTVGEKTAHGHKQPTLGIYTLFPLLEKAPDDKQRVWPHAGSPAQARPRNERSARAEEPRSCSGRLRHERLCRERSTPSDYETNHPTSLLGPTGLSCQHFLALLLFFLKNHNPTPNKIATAATRTSKHGDDMKRWCQPPQNTWWFGDNPPRGRRSR